MSVVMQPGHTRAERDAVAQHIEEAGLRTNIMEGVERTVIGVIGDSHTKELLRESLETLPGVERVVRILQPYKLVHREFHGGKDSVVWVRDVAIGGGRVVVMAGPCTVETRGQTMQTARAVKAAGAQILRGGGHIAGGRWRVRYAVRRKLEPALRSIFEGLSGCGGGRRL